MSLGPKGASRAARQEKPGDDLFQKTEPEGAAESPGKEKKEPLVRKTLEIGESLDDRLKYYCMENRTKYKTEAAVIRDALDQFLPPLPEGLRRTK